MIEFFVKGNPAPQGSKNAAAQKKNGRYTGKVNLYESSKALKPWRDTVTWFARRRRQSEPLEGPLVLTVDFYLPKPAKTKYPDYPLGTPDTDKLLRAIGDALTQSGLIRDDAQFVDTHARKRWATEKPGALIRVESLRVHT
ncbi:RusA family crossover junction endodeoxyribonuclease [Glutamicibacter creatinolyticus]|uniref:RusA family crossover junction endodeoxyribonuclease n=1 Tax=Glutamicibacter creatinolyticus TaxID=162496 RepID=UPI0032180DEA